MKSAGFNLSAIACSGTANEAVDLANRRVTVPFVAGQTISCTFTNDQAGSLSVVKDTVPDGPQDFSFTANNAASPASFQLDDDANATLSNTQLLSGVVDGQSYVITEAASAGFNLSAIACSGTANEAVDLANRRVTVPFVAGQTISCTFTNDQAGSLSVVKDTVPDGPQDFSFTANNAASPASFQLDDDANATLSNTQLLSGVVDGQSYVITEAASAGFNLSAIACSGTANEAVDLANRRVTVPFVAGQTISCTFTNDQAGSLSVVKDTVPDGPQDFSFTANNAASPASFQLDDDAERDVVEHAAPVGGCGRAVVCDYRGSVGWVQSVGDCVFGHRE